MAGNHQAMGLGSGDAPIKDRGPTKVYSVTEVNVRIKRLLEGETSLHDIWIQGEVSNLKQPGKGNLFFSLKDESTQLSCVMFKTKIQALEFKLEDGLKILARGRVGVYQLRGVYQLIVEDIHPAGKGALFLKYEQLKKRLLKEGLFDDSYKSDLPIFPRCIGVVTSPTGSAIKDILRVLDERYPLVRVVLSPALVQGAEAPGSIIAALKRLMRFGDIDVIILGRGGGSFEDLWPFSDEELARAVFQCSIPIVTGIGHETDVSICDLVADASAPTPSAAAATVVVDNKELFDMIATRERILLRAMDSIITMDRTNLSQLMDRPCLRYPTRMLEAPSQRVDELGHRLSHGIESNYQWASSILHEKKTSLITLDPSSTILSNRMALSELRKRLDMRCQRLFDSWDQRLGSKKMSLELFSPKERIRVTLDHVSEEKKNLLRFIQFHFKGQEHELGALGNSLDALSPLRTLDRGYAIPRKLPDKEVITSVDQVRPHEDIQVVLKDGELDCIVKDISEVRSWQRRSQ